MAQSEAVDLFVSTEPEVEVDAETAAAIERGIRAMEAGDWVPSEEVPELIKQWISKYATANQR
jgi:predicted transcriptional regulator